MSATRARAMPMTVSSRASGARPAFARWTLMRSMQYCSAAATSAEGGGATWTGGMAVGAGGTSATGKSGAAVAGTGCWTTTTGVSVTTSMTPATIGVTSVGSTTAVASGVAVTRASVGEAGPSVGSTFSRATAGGWVRVATGVGVMGLIAHALLNKATTRRVG